MRSNPKLPDQPVRDNIVSVLDENFLIEAGAGTGKTTALIGRMLALIKQGKCTSDSLAAITFTRKAAAELRSRFQVKLQDEARTSKGVEQQRLRSALQSIEQCFIGTIHSFCARLLRERPVEAGVDLSFTELDDESDKKFRSQTWDGYVALLYEKRSRLLEQLNEVGLPVGQLRSAFLTITNYPDVDEWPCETSNPPDAKVFIQCLQDYISHIDEISSAFPQDTGSDELMLQYKKLSRLARAADFRQHKDVIALLKLCKTVKVTQKNWPDGQQQGKTEKERWQAFCERYQPLLDQYLGYRYSIVLSVLRPAVNLYEETKRQQGVLNFQDLLLYTACMLRNSQTARRYFQTRITHLLVDEFQDTDPIQAEVMMLLTGDDLDEVDWTKCRPAPGSLFVVGDPKQSIYRFRRADIQVYNQVKAIIQRHGGRVSALTTNFRTDGPILKFVNEVFQSKFPKTATPQSPEYIALEGPVPEDMDTPAHVYSLSISEDCKTTDEMVADDADRIAAIIAAQIAGGRPANGFMIVTFKKHHMSAYAQALQQRGVPYQVTGGGVLADNQANQWLALCLKAAIQPNNPIALAALLRSGLFGFSDPELYAFQQAGGVFQYQRYIPPGDAQQKKAFEAVFAKLKHYADSFNSFPLVVALQRMADDLGLFAWCSAQPESNFLSGGLAKLIESIRVKQNEWTSLDECLDYVDAVLAGDAALDGVEAKPPSDPGVRIMNLHKVKGLEAPTIFLADPNGKSSHAPSVHIQRSDGAVKGYFVVEEPSPFGYHQTTLAQPETWQEFQEIERQFLDAEFYRLLYVAATRAKHQLIISKRVKGPHWNPWRELVDNLPEYECDTDEINLVQTDVRPVSENEYARGYQNNWPNLLKPTYQIISSKDHIVDSFKPVGANHANRDESALEWGNYVHSMLRLHIKHPELDIESVAQRIGETTNIGDEMKTRGIDMLRAVLNSSILKRARKSSQFFTEVPFQSFDIPSVPAINRGVIDLVFKENHGWVIVDYKTDAVSKKTLHARFAHYLPQINAYADQWARAVREPVVETGLYFVSIDEYVSTC